MHLSGRAGRRTRLGLAILLLPVLLGGCSQEATDQWARFGLPPGASEESHIVVNLWRGSWIVAGLVGILMFVLIYFSAFAFRRRKHETGFPPQVRYNVPIEVLFTATPFIVIAVLFFFTARDEARLLRISDSPQNVINVVGKRWSWDFNYRPSPGNPVQEGVYETGTPGEPCSA